jgi:hypothetical protein
MLQVEICPYKNTDVGVIKAYLMPAGIIPIPRLPTPVSPTTYPSIQAKWTPAMSMAKKSRLRKATSTGDGSPATSSGHSKAERERSVGKPIIPRGKEKKEHILSAKSKVASTSATIQERNRVGAFSKRDDKNKHFISTLHRGL